MFGAVLSALARWFLPSRKQEGREAEQEPATPAERQPAPPSQTQAIASSNEVLPTAPAVPREAQAEDTKELSRPSSLSEAVEVSPKEPASASSALAEVANLRGREAVQTLDTSDQQPPTSVLQQPQPSDSPQPACAAPALRAPSPAKQTLPTEEPSRLAFQSAELADASFETKLEAVKEARRSPDDDVEASKSATLQRKLDKAKEVSSKSATLQKKLMEAKAGRATSPARAEAQPAATSSESSATTVSKTAILQKKLDEARRSVLFKAAAEEVPEKAMQANEDVEMEALEESTFEMKPGDEAAIKATSSKRPSSPDKQDNMEARVADLMGLQEAAKSRRRGVVEKAKSVNREEGSSASRREKRAADDMEEALEETRTPKKKRSEETKSPEEPRQVRRASVILKGAKKMTEGSAPQKQAVESESTDHGKDAPARERGARPKAWSKPAAQDGTFLDTGAEERPFNVFRAKVDVSDGFADSGKPKTQPQSKPSDFKEKESEESDSSPSEPSRWRAQSEHSEQDDPELRDWRWLQQPTQAPAPRSASEEEMAADATNQALKSKKKKRRRKAKGAASSATKSVQSTALSEPALPSASKKDRPKRKRRKAHVEKEETTPPKGKRTPSPEGTTPKADRSDFPVQQELGPETSSEVRGAEDIMSVSSGSDNTDYGVIDCRFISENDAALGLRRRIQRHKTRALEEAKKDEKKARKKAKKAAKRALKAKRKADTAEQAAGCRTSSKTKPMWPPETAPVMMEHSYDEDAKHLDQLYNYNEDMDKEEGSERDDADRGGCLQVQSFAAVRAAIKIIGKFANLHDLVFAVAAGEVGKNGEHRQPLLLGWDSGLRLGVENNKEVVQRAPFSSTSKMQSTGSNGPQEGGTTSLLANSSPPKRLREGGAGTDEDKDKVTLASIREAIREQLREERHILSGELREGLAEVHSRIDTVEKCTTALCRTVTDQQVKIDSKVTSIEQHTQDLGTRLELLEGKFATAQFNVSSNKRGSEGSTAEPVRPALVLGGWAAEQAASETLRLVKQHVAQLEIDLDMDEAFVPGLRRGFAILPLRARQGETQMQLRGRVQAALATIREAKIVTGPRPEGRGRNSALEVEFGTADVWYNATKIASGVTTGPDGATTTPGGWLNLAPLARQLGTSGEALEEAWKELRKVYFLSWNVGGLQPEKALRMLSSLRQARIHPFCGSFVILLQEMIIEPGKHFAEHDDLQLFAGKLDKEWRGTGIAHTDDITRSACKTSQCSTSCTIQVGNINMIATSLHIPHHASMAEAGEILEAAEHQLRKKHKGLLGMDANETFVLRGNSGLDSETGRGEMILGWLERLQLIVPEHNIDKPSYFPYNHRLQPRRLDYVALRHLPGESGDVLAQRDVASSDHEPVLVSAAVKPAKRDYSTRAPEWGSRRLRGPTVVKQILEAPLTSGDPLDALARTAVAITVPEKVLPHFQESKVQKKLRATAISHRGGAERRGLWKQDATHGQEHRKWRKQLLDRTAIGDWNAKMALTQSMRSHEWELPLTDDPQWREKLTEHFENIFQKQDSAIVEAKFAQVDGRLARLCKGTAWIPFSMEEFVSIRKRWKNGRACGPDMVSHEAMKAMLQHPLWGGMMLELFNDMLYTAKIPQSIERGVSILLAKTSQPGDWTETRPITLSSALLKAFSQLLLLRAGEDVMTPARLQWSRQSRQGVELMILRRVCRIAFDFGLEMFVVKLDIRKAFDSVYQEAMADRIEADVALKGGKPWEARAWAALLRSGKLSINFRGTTLQLDQTNGVRQGSPDSPVAFGAAVARDLDDCIREAKASKPTTGGPPPEDGGSYMDDTYIWPMSRTHMQKMLDLLGDKLPQKGLFLHPGKVDIISNKTPATFQVAGKEVKTKGENHIMTVLGSPMAFHLVPSNIVIAAMQTSGRKAFWTHRGELMAKAPISKKMILHTMLVRQSALWGCATWPCNAQILKQANSIQLAHIRDMAGMRRGDGEGWTTWNQRTLRRSQGILFRHGITKKHPAASRWSTFILEQIWGLLGHMCRGDPVGGQLLRWRCLAWWNARRPPWGNITHARRFNAYMDTDRQVTSVAGENWHQVAMDRNQWSSLLQTWIDKYDVPWASGRQTSITNLTPHRSTSSDARGGEFPPPPPLTT
ncbi:pol [Symbiodinium sp. CCMP2456]|nr:pol [Symbiodinium sp. CCMP2456]